VNFNSRMKGLTVFGGVSLGHQVSNTCDVEGGLIDATKALN